MIKDILKLAFEAGEEFNNECNCGKCDYCLDVKDDDGGAPDFEQWFEENINIIQSSEQNNGWIKINSWDDLPDIKDEYDDDNKEEFDVYSPGTEQISSGYDASVVAVFYGRGSISHYKPTNVKPPIY